MAEIQKSAKSTFRPRTKCRRRQNLRFAHGRNAKNGKINVSATGNIVTANDGKHVNPLRLLKTLPVLEKYIRNRLITIACFFVSACY